MKINYTINENKIITGYSITPFDANKPYISVKNPDKEILVGYSQLIDGKIKLNKDKYDEDKLLNSLRKRRQEECFNIVNRGEVWYNTLTQEQKEEIQNWYQAWLDVTDTKEIPIKPEWL